jgi:uncharacterized protein (TIGR02145 family)
MSTAGRFKWAAAAVVTMAVVMNCAESLQEQPSAQSGGGTAARAEQPSPTPPQSNGGGAAAQAELRDLPQIAVYVTGNVADGEKKVFGTRMLTALINSGRYKGIERSNAFLAEIDKEHIKQRSGAIDDGQISALGKQFGVQFICIADLTPAFGAFQVSARIVNVETAEVPFIGDASSPLKTMDDLEQVSKQVVKNMFGGQASPIPGKITDSRDGKTYKSVGIGSQTWMAENLNYETPKSKCYDNAPSNCAKYGRLYTWDEAMNGAAGSNTDPSGVQGACPAGWHLPSSAEWITLIKYVDVGSNANRSEIAGTKLKSEKYWSTYKNVPKGTDDFGFSALPGGFGHTGFLMAGIAGQWWSASGTTSALVMSMANVGESAIITADDKTSLLSVRCVQD